MYIYQIPIPINIKVKYMIYTKEELKDILKNLGTTEREKREYYDCQNSVTTIRDCFTEPFDAPKQAAYCSKRDYDKPGSKYYLKTPEMILEEWEAAGEAGKLAGRTLDDYIGYLLEGCSESKEKKLLETIENSTDIVKRKLDAFKSYKESELEPLRFEFMSRERKLAYLKFNVKGRYDAIFLIEKNDKPIVVLVDWKNDKEIKTENKYSKLFGPLHLYDACELNSYTIQVFIYKYILRKKYHIDNEIVPLIVNVKEDKVINYKPQIPYSDELVEEILKFGNKFLDKE